MIRNVYGIAGEGNYGLGSVPAQVMRPVRYPTPGIRVQPYFAAETTYPLKGDAVVVILDWMRQLQPKKYGKREPDRVNAEALYRQIQQPLMQKGVQNFSRQEMVRTLRLLAQQSTPGIGGLFTRHLGAGTIIQGRNPIGTDVHSKATAAEKAFDQALKQNPKPADAVLETLAESVLQHWNISLWNKSLQDAVDALVENRLIAPGAF